MNRLGAAVLGVIVGAVTAGVTRETEKSQAVRLLDVFVLGPGLLGLALRPNLTVPERLALAFIGGATVGYNAVNLLDTARR